MLMHTNRYERDAEGQVASRAMVYTFLQATMNLLNSVRLYSDNNQRLIESVKGFQEIGGQLMREAGELSIVITGGIFYIQEEKVLYERRLMNLFYWLTDFFEERELDGLFFYPELEGCPLEDVIKFARICNEAIRQKNPFVWLTIEMGDDRFSWVKLYRHEESDSMMDVLSEAMAETDDLERQTAIKLKQKAISTYSCTMESLDEVAGKIVAGRGGVICKSVHLVQNMVDLILAKDTTLLGLSTIRDYDDYLFTHSVNVAILSIWIGHRIGLSKRSLERLGLSGLFHDLGKIDIPKGILNKPEKLNDVEFAEIKKHTLKSVGRIIHLKTSFEKKAQILLAPFEHHLKYDLTGYLQSPRKTPQSLFGRIVAIADVYDAITSPRIYRDFAWSPDTALGEMLKESGRSFDPVLLKVFINMMGIYPIGTVLKFEDGRMGVVARYSSEADEPARLMVQLLEFVGEEGYQKGELLDIGPLDPETCGFDVLIAGTLHPSELGIQPAEFLL